MTESVPTEQPKSSKVSMIAAAVAAIDASLCYIGLLALVSSGITGGWIGSLTALNHFSRFS